MHIRHFILCVILFFSGRYIADASTKEKHPSDTLTMSILTADKGVTVSRTDTIDINTFNSTTEALSIIPGITINDMGGMAGLKTANIRGLGATHTSIYFDGIKISNIQSGQSDIGMIELMNIDNIVIDYAQNRISLNTSRIKDDESPLSGRVRFGGGSFGTFSPSARVDYKMSQKLSMRLSLAGNTSKGDFTYTDRDSTFRRQNNDISQINAGADIFGSLNEGEWHGKLFINDAERGTPGSISLKSEDRQKDLNLLAQAMIKKDFSNFYHMNASAKFSYDDQRYQSEWGDSRYIQKGFHANSSHLFSISRFWDLCLTAGASWQELESSSYSYERTGRLEINSTLSSSLDLKNFNADFSVEYNRINDKVVNNLPKHTLNPSLGLNYRLGNNLKINAFIKKNNRFPTFNELYYIGYGNPELIEEDAWLSDLGIEYTFDSGNNFRMNLKGNAYFNRISNKIVSAPSKEDLSVWYPYNIGRVNSIGADLLMTFEYKRNDWRNMLSIIYNCNDSKDMTSKAETYKKQIPYIAKHSIVLNEKLKYRKWEINLIWNIRKGLFDNSGERQDWNTINALFSRVFHIGGKNEDRYRIQAGLSIINLTDTAYQLSAGYPMPGRHFNAVLTFSF